MLSDNVGVRLLLLATLFLVPATAQAQYVNFGDLDAYNAQLAAVQRNLMIDAQRSEAAARQRERDALIWREQYLKRQRIEEQRRRNEDNRRRVAEQRNSDERRRNEDDRRRFEQQRRDEEIRRQMYEDQRRRDEEDRRRRDEQNRRR